MHKWTLDFREWVDGQTFAGMGVLLVTGDCFNPEQAFQQTAECPIIWDVLWFCEVSTICRKFIAIVWVKSNYILFISPD